MLQGYQNPRDEFQDLDEFLCEYVDGTIDPVVRTALEEYMCMNPRLADHVRELQQTREMLQCYGSRCCKESNPESFRQQKSEKELDNRNSPSYNYRTLFSIAVAALISFAVLQLDKSNQTDLFKSQLPPLLSNSYNLSLYQTPLLYTSENNYFAVFARTNKQSSLYPHPFSLPYPPASSPDSLEMLSTTLFSSLAP